MQKPKPEVGLVVRYDYLWRDEAMRGRQEGAKERPCAVIQSTQKDEQGGYTVLLAPITHTPPNGQNEGIEIPHKVTKHLGLDDDRQWIKTTELNRVSWNDAGITPAKKNQWEYGRLPKGIYDQTKQEIQQNARVKKMAMMKRDVEEQKTENQSTSQSQKRGQDQGQKY